MSEPLRPHERPDLVVVQRRVPRVNQHPTILPSVGLGRVLRTPFLGVLRTPFLGVLRTPFLGVLRTPFLGVLRTPFLGVLRTTLRAGLAGVAHVLALVAADIHAIRRRTGRAV